MHGGISQMSKKYKVEMIVEDEKHDAGMIKAYILFSLRMLFVKDIKIEEIK
jgi:hypothetical protein